MRQDSNLLRNDHFRLVVEPANGGLVSSLTYQSGERTLDILHAPADRPASPDGIPFFGCWPMLPFANRCFNGVLLDGDEKHYLPINDSTSGNTMHGYGWQAAWKVEAMTRSSLRMRHICDGSFGPYAYDANLEIALANNGVRLALSITHLGMKPLPYGIGFHPWFSWQDDATLLIEASQKAEFAPGYRPIGITDLGISLRQAKSLSPSAEIAVNFNDWRGEAVLDYPGSHRVLIDASPSLRKPLLWKPAHTRFMCFEPQSHVIGVPGHDGGAQVGSLQRLGKGETLSGWMSLKIEGCV